MCGIIGISSQSNVVPNLLDGLKKMEYRGYDSSGMVVENDKKFTKLRAKGKLDALIQKNTNTPLSGNTGIAHIRWATHGGATIENAHPHSSKQVTLVHNGIIENWQPIKEELINKGYSFKSETDTEVIVLLIQSYLDDKIPAQEAFYLSTQRLEGAYAIAAMIEEAPDTIFVARFGSPLVVGLGNKENYVGSDAISLAKLTNKVQFLEEGDYAVINHNEVKIYNKQRQAVKRPISNTNINTDTIEKGEYSHFMLKEIYEQPSIISSLINKHIDLKKKVVYPIDFGFNSKEVDHITLVACGTAYHAAMLAKYWIESLANINVSVDFASEYRYRHIIQPKNGVFIAISQSGETADTLAALRRAKKENQHILSVINSESSSIARESHEYLSIFAGTEIGVASTKAFTAQCFVILMIAISIAKSRGQITLSDEQSIVNSLLTMQGKIDKILEQKDKIKAISKSLSTANSTLFLGRDINYPTALEAALKLKEVSYIHAEAYASGEMKHGAIALIDEHIPVVCIIPKDRVTDKSLSNMQEVIARNAQVILVADKDTCDQQQSVKHKIIMPNINPILSPILYTIPMQMLAYYTALILEKDVDQPRNLAKSVTVE